MRRLLLSSLTVAALVAPAAAEITVGTAQGEVTLPDAPRTVAVYDMAALDSLLALGVQPAGTIENVTVPALRAQVQDAARVGTLFEPDLEALAGLAPDLIVVGGRSSTQLAAVSQVAPAIDMTFGPDLLSDARARIDGYGAIFGKAGEAAELNASLDAQLAALREAAEGQGRALIVLTNGTRMSAYGKGSRFGWIFEAAGLEEAAPGLDHATHGQAITHEFIAEVNPDWLFVVDRGAAIGEDGQGAEATLRSALVEGTAAWTRGQVVYLDPGAAYISAGGYSAMSLLMGQLTDAFSAADPS
ncbi:siderophore ABC transporter substrate-binding protein [Paracoccus tibetensis]|uniref:Iron complex transport system substrate-binding protein n=1 Tax=Paracoccus tibetensis TaxID=336292 RepID=A0A1G5FUJ0_9RHOB|nr:siderophore ABC transporter substrate-binding protein [Paracoccus tibetensis]SCY42985.1 iron complex transport system substrate-binding protein [Paracoccus tibetensis]